MRVFPKVNWLTLAWCGPKLLTLGTLPEKAGRCLRAETFTLSSDEKVPFEVDGELVGHLPATFSLEREKLRALTLADKFRQTARLFHIFPKRRTQPESIWSRVRKNC